MEAKYFDQLLPDTKELLLLIENHVGEELTVREDQTRKILGCDIDKLTILTPVGQFRDSSVMHELLHFRRVLIDGIPQLVVCDTFDFFDYTFETNINILDNNIEHLFIVPEEISLRPNRKNFWENIINENIETQEKRGLDVRVDGGDAILNWVLTHHVLGDGCVIDKATNVAQKLNCEEIAKKLLSTLKLPNCNKEIFARAYLVELSLPKGYREYLCLKYFNREEKLFED